MRAQIEENEIGIRETCKTREEFEENVVRKGIDSITGKITAEKFIRCYIITPRSYVSIVTREHIKSTVKLKFDVQVYRGMVENNRFHSGANQIKDDYRKVSDKES